MKILSVFYLFLLSLVAKSAISDVRSNRISVSDLLFPAFFIFICLIVIFSVLTA